jgi:hypothetical protein
MYFLDEWTDREPGIPLRKSIAAGLIASGQFNDKNDIFCST